MKSTEYWTQRFEALRQSFLDMDDQFYYDEVEKQFRLAERELEKEISLWYKRLAANNDISMAAAKVLLSGKELQEFRWSVEDYIKRGQESGISGKWVKELENASARAHITQLDALKLQMQQQLESLYGNQVDGLDRHLQKTYSEGFYRTAYEVDKGIGIGTNLRQLDDERLQNVVSKPWCGDGKVFSDRLWRDKDALNSTLQRELSQAVIRGDGFDGIVQGVAKRMNVAVSSASRLVMTESAFFATAGQRDCFADLGVKQYEFVATLDRRTSDICQDMDGKVFDLKDLRPGTNAPPMHCRCRSCIVPYFGDDEGLSGTRAARDPETGKTVQVPAKMTYSEWKTSFVKENEQNYKPVSIDANAKESFRRMKTKIATHKVTTAANELYLSDDAELKPRALHRIDTGITNALDKIDAAGSSNLPTAVIVSEREMQSNALAAYNPYSNMLYLQATLGDRTKLSELQKDCACPTNPLSTFVHEYLHWQDAERYRQKYGAIDKDYIHKLRLWSKKQLEKLSADEYNEISRYADDCIENSKFDEAYTEYRVKKLLKE